MDPNWQVDARGLPGQQSTLQLLLRVVADVGIVGFPNAGAREGRAEEGEANSRTHAWCMHATCMHHACAPAPGPTPVRGSNP